MQALWGKIPEDMTEEHFNRRKVHLVPLLQLYLGLLVDIVTQLPPTAYYRITLPSLGLLVHMLPSLGLLVHILRAHGSVQHSEASH